MGRTPAKGCQLLQLSQTLQWHQLTLCFLTFGLHLPETQSLHFNLAVCQWCYRQATMVLIASLPVVPSWHDALSYDSNKKYLGTQAVVVRTVTDRC